jgi:hypothetical protein
MTLLSTILFLALPPLVGLLVRLIWPRAKMYEYASDGPRRRPELVGYVNSRGHIVDVTRPRAENPVGRVVLRDGRGVVLVRRDEEAGPEELREVGWVDDEGRIFAGAGGDGPGAEGGRQIGTVSPGGSRRWYELWLCRHSDVPAEAEEPFGKCAEAIRLKGAPPNAPTLLARAGAALLLYRKEAEAADEAAEPLAHGKWDTALPAALLFTVLFQTGLLLVFDGPYVLFPFAGQAWSYVATALLFYFAIWLVLHLVKVVLTENPAESRAWLMLLNRQTGIRRWTLSGLALASAGLAWGFFFDAYTYLPLFAANFIGFMAVQLYAPARAWRVAPRARRPLPFAPEPGEQQEGEPPAGTITHNYRWRLMTVLGEELKPRARLRFAAGEIDAARASNPFRQDYEAALSDAHAVSAALVLRGETAPQVERLAREIIAFSNRSRLTMFDEVQTALGFVQNSNIAYALDEECEETGRAPEYFRLPVETLFDRRGDCDCKAILAAALMRRLGYPVLLILDYEHEHAALAVGGVPELGEAAEALTFEHDGARFYFCETTGDGWEVGQEAGPARAMLAAENVVDLTADLPPPAAAPPR